MIISWCIRIVLLLAFLGFAQQAQAARIVTVSVYVGDVVILEGFASDDGTPDADEAWSYLRTVRLKPTSQFERFDSYMATKDGLIEIVATGRLSVAYGGTKQFRKAVFKRITNENGTVQYQLDSELVDKWFDSRLISRREAAGLARPAKLGSSAKSVDRNSLL